MWQEMAQRRGTMFSYVLLVAPAVLILAEAVA